MRRCHRCAIGASAEHAPARIVPLGSGSHRRWRFVRGRKETDATVLDTKAFVLRFKTCADQYGLRVVRDREKFYVVGVKLAA